MLSTRLHKPCSSSTVENRLQSLEAKFLNGRARVALPGSVQTLRTESLVVIPDSKILQVLVPTCDRPRQLDGRVVQGVGREAARSRMAGGPGLYFDSHFLGSESCAKRHPTCILDTLSWRSG